MRILVTGGGGFIGSHLAERLLASGQEVVVVDRQPRNRIDGVKLIEADLADRDVAARAARGVDAVCHLAARVGLGRDFSDAPAYAYDNDLATATLLAALADRGFRGRLVLASSMVVYGEGAYRCATHGVVRPAPRLLSDLASARFEPRCPRCSEPLDWAVVDEAAEPDPRSVYAASKVSQEYLCRVWARETGASVVALRYHNVYGRRLPLGTPYAGVAALFRDRLRRGQPPLVFEDGGQMRDFVHVNDVVESNVVALQHHQAPGGFEAFNIASGRPVSILEVARMLAERFGPRGQDPLVTSQSRVGDVRHVVASPQRARECLGFTAKVRLEDGMADLADEPLGAEPSKCT
jgi:dTDP-L-rhamnose 4-epimerase